MDERPKEYWRVRTPTVIQMEAVECGAACLAILLEFYGKYVPLEELRIECGVSRDGSNAFNVIKAAGCYGLEGKGYQKTVEDLFSFKRPVMVFWEYNHYVILEGFSKNKVYLNDPGMGPRTISYEELEESYSGVMFDFVKTETFEEGGKPPRLGKEILNRIKHIPNALTYLSLAGLFLIVPGLALPAFTRIFVDNVLDADLLSWKRDLILAMLLGALIAGALTWLQKYYLNKVGGKLSLQFSSDFLWHILKLPMRFYTQRYPGEIAYRMTYNNIISQILTGNLATTFIDLVLIFFYALVMFFYDPLLAGFGVIAGIINMGVMAWISRARSDSYARLQQENAKYVGNAIGAIKFMETLKAAGIESDFFSRLMGYFTKNVNAQQDISLKDTFLATCPYLFQALTLAAVLGFGGYQVINGQLSIGMLIALQTLMLSFLAPITRFVNFGQLIQNLKIDVARLNDVLRNQTDVIYTYRNQDSKEEEVCLDGYLDFRDVTFGYSPLAPPLIEKLSLSLKPGFRVALVGPTGCGKSTIAKLASNLFQPWSGEVFYDHKLFRDLPYESLHTSISTVDQEIFLFEGTIWDNLTLWDQTITEEAVFKACHDAHIHHEILERPDGYNTLLTEGGMNLSGGQRQRLEIARALIKNPSILIMDEATSSLDSETEEIIINKIHKRGCTMIMVAHRLSTIKDCEEIIVLDHGKVVQRGTHEELKKTEGIYKGLVEVEG